MQSRDGLVIANIIEDGKTHSCATFGRCDLKPQSVSTFCGFYAEISTLASSKSSNALKYPTLGPLFCLWEAALSLLLNRGVIEM